MGDFRPAEGFRAFPNPRKQATNKSPEKNDSKIFGRKTHSVKFLEFKTSFVSSFEGVSKDLPKSANGRQTQAPPPLDFVDSLQIPIFEIFSEVVRSFQNREIGTLSAISSSLQTFRPDFFSEQRFGDSELFNRENRFSFPELLSKSFS